jgi:predicted nucleic acid-binding Zn ribbon protein
MWKFIQTIGENTMTKCINCNVLVHGQHKHCPLCDRRLPNDGNNKTEYPAYKEIKHQRKTFAIYKIYLFLTIASIIILVTTNLLTFHDHSALWSVIVTACLLFPLITVRNIIVSKIHIGGKIFVQFVSLSVLLFVIDMDNQFSKWSTNYVIPILTIITTMIITIVAMSRKGLWFEYAGYLFAAFFISLCPLVFHVFKLADVLWPSVAAVVYSLLTMIGLFMLSDKEFKDEIKKRFHF